MFHMICSSTFKAQLMWVTQWFVTALLFVAKFRLPACLFFLIDKNLVILNTVLPQFLIQKGFESDLEHTELSSLFFF